MSYVSGVVLTVHVCEEADEDAPLSQITAINAWLDEQGKGVLADLTSHMGGRKHPQIFVYGGGFNYLDEEAFVSVVREQSWAHPDNVCLIINPEQGAVQVYRPGRMTGGIAQCTSS